MFRLRLSNNRLEDVNNTANLASLAAHAKKLKINRNSAATKMSVTYPNGPYLSRNTTFYYNSMTSKANSISNTPTELTLPIIMDGKKKSRKSSKSSLGLSTKKNSLVKNDFQHESLINIPSTTVNAGSESCNCILCNSNTNKFNNYKNYLSLNSNDMFILDSRNFLNCLSRMKPTIKMDRDTNFSELAQLSSNSQTSADFSNSNHTMSTLFKIKNNNEVIKLLPASSRIKLWEPDEVSNYINNEDLNKKAISTNQTISNNNTPTLNEISSFNKKNTKETLLEQSKLDIRSESRLNKIFKQFRVNPNLSPLIYKANHNATISFQQVLTPSTTNKPVMPVLSKTPTMMYRVPMNSALNFYDC